MNDILEFLSARAAERRLGQPVSPNQAAADAIAIERVLNALWFAGQVTEVRGRAGEVIAGGAGAVNDVVRILAQPFHDHLDYRAEWRP